MKKVSFGPGALVWFQNEIRNVAFIDGEVAHLLKMDFTTQPVPVAMVSPCYNVEISTGRLSPGTILNHKKDGIFVVSSVYGNGATLRCIASHRKELLGVNVMAFKGNTEAAKGPHKYNCSIFRGGAPRLAFDAIHSAATSEPDDLSSFADYDMNEFAVIDPHQLLAATYACSL